MYKKILLSTVLAAAISSSAFAESYQNANIVPANTAPAYIPPPALGIYVGLGYGYTSVEDDYFEYFPNSGLAVQTDINYDAVMFQAGYQYNPFFAFEFRYWTAFSGGDYSISSNYPPLYPPAAGSYDNFDAWGFYLKPMYPVTPDFSIYGLLGFSGVYISGEPGWDLLDEGSYSWGLGASYAITPNILIFADYVQLFNGGGYGYGYDYYDYDYDSDQDTRVNTINIGLTYRF